MDIKFFVIIFALLILFLGIFVWLKNTNKKLNISFFILCLISSLWCISLFFYEKSFILTSEIWIKVVYTFVFLLIPPYVVFAYLFPIKGKRSPKKILIIYSFISLPLLWILYFTKLWIIDVQIEDYGPKILFNDNILILSSSLWTLFAVWIFFDWLKKYKELKGIAKTQLNYLTIGYVGLFVIIFIIDVLMPIFFHARQLFWLSPIALLFLFICSSYAIIRYRLMNIVLVIKKGTAHFISLIIILALYSSLIIFGQQLLVEKYNWDLTVATIIAVLIIAISVEPLRRLVIQIVNKVLYTSSEKKYFENIETAKFYATKSMAVGKAARTLEEIVHQIICDYLYFISPDQIKLFHYSEETKKLECVFPKKETFSIEIKSDLCYYMNKHAEIVITQEIPYQLENKGLEDRDKLKNIEKLFHKNDIEAAIPIGDKDNMLGLFLLGNKVDNTIYTKEDIELLKGIRHDYTPILFNTIMYKEAIERAGVIN